MTTNEIEYIKVYLRVSRDQTLKTFDWLRDLYEKGALDMDNLRQWQQDIMEANDALRKRLIEKYNLDIK